MKQGRTKFTIPRRTVEALLARHVEQVFANEYQLQEFTIRKDGSVEMVLDGAVKEPQQLPFDDQPKV